MLQLVALEAAATLPHTCSHHFTRRDNLIWRAEEVTDGFFVHEPMVNEQFRKVQPRNPMNSERADRRKRKTLMLVSRLSPLNRGFLRLVDVWLLVAARREARS